MEKVCGIVVLLALYQLTGMLNYHGAPVVKHYQVISACNTASQAIGIGSMC